MNCLKSKIFKYRTQYIAPLPLRVTGALLIILNILFLYHYNELFNIQLSIFWLINIFIGYLIMQCHKGFMIDLEQKRYYEYISFLGYKHGVWKKFKSLDNLEIKQHLEKYELFLNVDQSYGILILESTHITQIRQTINKIYHDLKLPIIDLT